MPIGRRSRNADDRDAARPLPLCRHSLVLDHVRPRRADHGIADVVVVTRGGARRVAPPGGLSGHDRRIRWPMRNPAKSCTRCAAAKWRRCAKFRSVSIMAASMRRRCSCCSPGSICERTGDTQTIVELWPNIEAALAWIDGPGDPDGDGFVEYKRASEQGLANQGWKDSYDAIFHADGAFGRGRRSRSSRCRAMSTPLNAWRRAARGGSNAKLRRDGSMTKRAASPNASRPHSGVRS